MSLKDKVNIDLEDYPILNSLNPFTEKEREQIRDIAIVVWYFFGRPRGDKATDYFLPVELCARFFKMNFPAKRLDFFRELQGLEGILAEIFNSQKEEDDDKPQSKS